MTKNYKKKFWYEKLKLKNILKMEKKHDLIRCETYNVPYSCISQELRKEMGLFTTIEYIKGFLCSCGRKFLHIITKNIDETSYQDVILKQDGNEYIVLKRNLDFTFNCGDDLLLVKPFTTNAEIQCH